MKRQRTYSDSKSNCTNRNSSIKKTNTRKMKCILSEPSQFSNYDDCPAGKVESLVNKIERKKTMFKYYNVWKKKDDNK